MPYKGERPLLMRMVISLRNEILNYLRALYIKTQGVHTPKGEVKKNLLGMLPDILKKRNLL